MAARCLASQWMVMAIVACRLFGLGQQSTWNDDKE